MTEIPESPGEGSQFTASGSIVAAPASQIVVSPHTWNDVLAAAATWNAVVAQFPTWNDVLHG